MKFLSINVAARFSRTSRGGTVPRPPKTGNTGGALRRPVANRVLAWAESVALFAALYVGLPGTGLTLDRYLAWAPLPTTFRFVGTVPLFLGSLGVGWCFFLFVKEGHGTPNPLVPPDTLVMAGPFRWTRNPIILSHALASLGLAMLVASPAAVLIVLLLGIPVQFVVRHEETVLEKRFGEAYRAYRGIVPRWIPRRPPQSR